MTRLLQEGCDQSDLSLRERLGLLSETRVELMMNNTNNRIITSVARQSNLLEPKICLWDSWLGKLMWKYRLYNECGSSANDAKRCFSPGKILTEERA